MTVGELQDSIWNVDKVRVVIHADPNHNLGEFEYWKNQLSGSKTITEFKQIRLSILTNAGIGFSVMNGDFQVPNGKTLMETLRSLY